MPWLQHRVGMHRFSDNRSVMPWIRSPWWDGLWFLSGFPLGLALMLISLFVGHHPIGGHRLALGIDPAIISIYLIVLFQMGHTLSPVMLAWSHSGLRSIMLRRPAKCILLPLLLLAVATLAGVVSAEEFPGLHFIDDATNRLIFANLFPRDGTLNVLTAPAWWVIVVYLLWNAYH